MIVVQYEVFGNGVIDLNVSKIGSDSADQLLMDRQDVLLHAGGL